MVLAYHFIFSAYGFWLPNDPRGSWSDTIRRYELLRFGSATKVSTPRSLAGTPHNVDLRVRAKDALMYKPVQFTGTQARAIYRGFVIAAAEAEYRLLALAILPDHTHLLVGRHGYHIDRIASHLKSKATRQLNIESLHPLSACPRSDGTFPSPWSRNYWCPFVDSEKYLRQAISYINNNPIKSGLPRQSWRGIPSG